MGRAGSIRTRSFAPLSLLLAAALCQAQEPDVSNLPKPTGYVSDLANVVTGQDKARLEAFCANVDQQLGVQFALVTINTIGDTPIERFSLDLARAWGVGAKQTNQGVLLLLVIKDRKSRIEVGRGAEPYITDGFSGRTLRSMRPDLTSGVYGAALLEGARAMAAELAKGKGIAFNEGDGLPPRAPPAEEPTGQSSGFPWGLILIGIFVLLFILRLFGRGGRGGGGGGGFWTGLLLSSLFNSGGRGSGWGDSGAAGGGGFGGDSGGGGGFGGFGGGDFGGGGASSDW